MVAVIKKTNIAKSLKVKDIVERHNVLKGHCTKKKNKSMYVS